jgi:hypothetical protein
VASRIPQGHRLRSSILTFGHFRVLVKMEDVELETWADKAINEDWSVARLTAELEAAGDQKAVQDGQPCIQCTETLSESGEIVAFTVKGMRARCCNFKCAAEYFTERAAEQNGHLDGPSAEDETSFGTEGETPFSAGLDLADLPDPDLEKEFAL